MDRSNPPVEPGVETPDGNVVVLVEKEVVELFWDEKKEVRRFTAPPSDKGVGREEVEGEALLSLLKIDGRRLNMAERRRGEVRERKKREEKSD